MNNNIYVTEYLQSIVFYKCFGTCIKYPINIEKTSGYIPALDSVTGKPNTPVPRIVAIIIKSEQKEK